MVDSPYSVLKKTPARYRSVHFQQIKDAGGKFAMLTCYDATTAQIFDHAGIETLLIGDSLGNVVQGQNSTLGVTMDDMITFSKAVVAGTERAFVLADLPFGSYEASVEQAVESGIQLVKETGISAVKMEGGIEYAPHIQALTAAGVAVVAHTGFTPQSEHVLGGYRVQGRDADASTRMVEEALVLQDAGAMMLLMEMVPAEVAAAVDQALTIPTVGIGAGNGTTGQVLVWQDAFGLNRGRVPSFVKKYADVGQVLSDAAQQYREDVLQAKFPNDDHSF
ncbi:3-methyl-2-oxobutanoate hydroxymethyltransferase [Enteractinococcus coprophilus]|uniref:3-methyl-2-oxobutanoate hydroxymethyltransferase n=1 Tax=Enteractinococcus coprophilus TaxID=1027633 RepID=A0A543AJR4_9MICC|nr:3-methyl-2-oxobutanoate hydroxymethyltransferase [Enteractinococcus coprophilus]TQL72825.1 3-methyl-2-oxobutanoate hydroxymethyltransferase [Enteractinococcus coprophilus]